MAQKFEYEVRRVEHAHIERELNHMARHGWRFVEFAPGSSFDIKCVFERAAGHPNTQALPTATLFQETTMAPTTGGNTQVFTGTFVPAGSVPPTDAVYAVTSNDPAVTPTVDATGLIVTGPLPSGWVESTTTPLAYTRTASSISNPTWTLSDIITPSAPPAGLPTSTTFAQTT